jgi:hypothetical protein
MSYIGSEMIWAVLGLAFFFGAVFAGAIALIVWWFF